MENGINFSRTFIACVTENYMRKVDGQGPNGDQDNCLKEFIYAKNSKTSARMLAVVMEDNCGKTSDWFGPLESTLGSTLYCSFTHDNKFEENMDSIIAELQKRLDFPIEQSTKAKATKANSTTKQAPVERIENENGDEEQEDNGDGGDDEPVDDNDDFADDPEPEFGEEGDLVCENGHKLKEFCTPEEGYSCNVCSEYQPVAAMMMSCQLCDFDMCGNCVSNFG